jgi:hypothetical protein
MTMKPALSSLITLSALFLPLFSQASEVNAHQAKHFNNIMVVMFENMSYAEIKNEPTFRKLVEYTGNTLDDKGKLVKLLGQGAKQDTLGNGYAFFSHYYNNHNGGKAPTRPSQPNYIAMTSGSIHGIKDNENHDLAVDNLASELIDAGISWKVYAENLPDPKLLPVPYQAKNAYPPSFYAQVKPYETNPALNEQENDAAEHQYYENAYKKSNYPYQFMTTSNCYTGATYPTSSSDGYKRKHEPFISYKNIQSNAEHCKNIVNSSHLHEDLINMPAVSFFIPNDVNNGHNGNLSQRVFNANAFLSKMMGTDPKTGEPLADAKNAPFQKFMAQGGLLVITFDEPSVTGNPDMTIYTLLAGNMINSGAYPNQSNQNAPSCYPPISEQTKHTRDAKGDYDPKHCNHYNLLRMIEDNWSLRGLSTERTSAGYKYAFSLDNNVAQLWKH